MRKVLENLKARAKAILNFKGEKASGTFILLAVINIVVLLVSNIIAANVFHVLPLNAQTMVNGFPEDLWVVLPCAVIVYPIVFITSDLISEIYGYVWSRRVCYLSFLCNVLMVGLFHVTNLFPTIAADLSVLNGTWYMLLAPFVSFLTGSLINDIVLKKMKIRDGEKNKALRFVVSSIWGQLLDASIFLILGMWAFPLLTDGALNGHGYVAMNWTGGQIIFCIITQVVVKVVYEIIVSPLMVKIADKVKATEKANGFSYGE